MTSEPLFSEMNAQADYIEQESLIKYNYDTSFHTSIRQELIDKRPKLLVGPRGVGKTHQMRISFLECAKDSEKPFAVYASFNQYYHLEPLSKNSQNARKIFHLWMLCHIVDSIQSCIGNFSEDLDFNVYEYLGIEKDDVKDYKNLAQKGHEPDIESVVRKITVNSVANLIRASCRVLGRKRTILLLDDAAMSLSNEYLYEFFEVYQALKDKDIAPKASVYPGTTQYGPKFHARHDADTILAWLFVDEDGYKATMKGIATNYLQGNEYPEEDIDILAYAAFGVPRTFINMLMSYRGRRNQKNNKVNLVIEEQASLITQEYESLKLKMPQFSTVIDVGKELSERMVKDLSEENAKLAGGVEKQVVIGIQKDASLAKPMVERMLSLLQEAGIIYNVHSVKHGPEREYERYIPHYALLIRARAFSFSRGTSHRNTVLFIERKSVQHPTRRTIKTLLPPEKIDSLHPNLPPCQNCHADRISEEQKFCHNCGKPLISKSVFETLLAIPIAQLPLSAFIKKKIKEETTLKTISDFISAQDPASDLRDARGIGKKRSERTIDVVNSYIDGFLN